MENINGVIEVARTMSVTGTGTVRVMGPLLFTAVMTMILMALNVVALAAVVGQLRALRDAVDPRAKWRR